MPAASIQRVSLRLLVIAPTSKISQKKSLALRGSRRAYPEGDLLEGISS
jgi:hypothetical protein